MLNFDERVFVFCENEVSSYEKTIYTLALAYADSPMFCVDDEVISDLAQLLMVNEELLKRALSGKVSFHYGKVLIRFGEKIVDCTEFFKNTFFTSIVKFQLAYKALHKIADTTDDDAIRENIQLIQSIIFYFDSINVGNATYECMFEQSFSRKHIVFDSKEFPPVDYLKTLQILTISDDCVKYDKSLLSIVSHLVTYELRTRLNTLYLIMITQVIMHSPFFEEGIHKMALEMYEHLMFIFKNGRIISVQVNSLYVDLDKEYDERTKRDNTTRLQILYAYENYDTYVLRIDLSHQGQPFIHFNNASPGDVCSYLFSKDEYISVLSRYPLLKSCFIEYCNDRWALKERNNCELTQEVASMFDAVEAEKAHKGVFSENISEESVVGFIELFSNMLPPTCFIPIDREGEHARRCFNYDCLIRDAMLIYVAYIRGEVQVVKRLIANIAVKACRYGLISKQEQSKCDSLFWVFYILHLANEKADITP